MIFFGNIRGICPARATSLTAPPSSPGAPWRGYVGGRNRFEVRRTLDRWKPAARARTHLLLAGLLWTCVGAGLWLAGVRWSAQSNPPWGLVLVSAGCAVGVAKGRWALERSARASAERIARRGDGKCLGGFLSWQSWVLVLGMMAAGFVLRRIGTPPAILGFVYTAVGAGLLWGSRIYWSARRRTSGGSTS